MPEPPAGRDAARIVEVEDERSDECRGAIELIEETFRPVDRHAPGELLSELEEKRRQLVPRNRPHLLAAVLEERVVGAAYGVYLAGPNCGFVAYVAVHPQARGGGIARRLRARLAECFRADAAADGHQGLAWIVGEVRRSSAWLEQLVRRRGAIPLDFTYYHPGMFPGGGQEPYTLYLEPQGDSRRSLPVLLVRRIVYQVYRIAYRVRHPLTRPGFRSMMDELEGREEVGANQEVMARAGEAAPDE
jgi:GNAT superfamily N-acetyltransferase